MAMQTEQARSPNWLALWWWRRLALRREIDLTAADMHDRYGAAAYALACNSARLGAGEERRFWRKVARRLRRKKDDRVF